MPVVISCFCTHLWHSLYVVIEITASDKSVFIFMRFKKALLICGLLGTIYIIGTYIYFSAKPFSSYDCPVHIPNTPPIPLEDPAYPGHHFKTINDASCLNETRVYDIIRVKSIEDIHHAVTIARE